MNNITFHSPNGARSVVKLCFSFANLLWAQMFDPKTCSSQVTRRIHFDNFRKAQMFDPKTCSSQVSRRIHFDNFRKAQMLDPKTCSSQVTSRVPNPFWLTIFRKAQMFEPKTCSSQVKEDFWIHFDNIRKLFKWKACNNPRASLVTTGNHFVIAASFFYIFLALNLYTLLVKIKCEFERFSLINLPFFIDVFIIQFYMTSMLPPKERVTFL
jgi:hypothetical protein